jgi:hypothetical protein
MTVTTMGAAAGSLAGNEDLAREGRRQQAQQLEALNTKSGALGERDKELTARDEARRLRDAAARAKAERKSG